MAVVASSDKWLTGAEEFARKLDGVSGVSSVFQGEPLANTDGRQSSVEKAADHAIVRFVVEGEQQVFMAYPEPGLDIGEFAANLAESLELPLALPSPKDGADTTPDDGGSMKKKARKSGGPKRQKGPVQVEGKPREAYLHFLSTDETGEQPVVWVKGLGAQLAKIMTASQAKSSVFELKKLGLMGPGKGTGPRNMVFPVYRREIKGSDSGPEKGVRTKPRKDSGSFLIPPPAPEVAVGKTIAQSRAAIEAELRWLKALGLQVEVEGVKAKVSLPED